MKLFLIQLLFLVFTHQGPGMVPLRNSRIIAKYVVADWDSHNYFSYCDEEAKAFLQMGFYSWGELQFLAVQIRHFLKNFLKFNSLQTINHKL